MMLTWNEVRAIGALIGIVCTLYFLYGIWRIDHNKE